MKKIAVILLLLCLVAPFAGSYLFLHIKKNKVKKEVREALLKEPEGKDLIVFKFTEEEARTKLDWKHNGEFGFNGHMYDIVDRGREGDLYIFTCYRDNRETRLNSETRSLIAKALGQDPFQKKQSEKIKNLFNTVFIQDVFAWKSSDDLSQAFRFSLFIFRFSSMKLTPLVPPPR